uniref:Beta-secretase (Trinotate prediction) n=1 Tax=Henneguya salminicola TaxID=69463 RepID=A0A6G3MEF3_HENSL
MGIPNQFWQGYQVMCWAFGTTPFNMFPEITLSLSSTNSEYLEFRLLITPQLYLREANDDNSHNLTQNCYRFAISKSEKGIVIGAVFMEGFYVIFDRENSQIGFAKSNCGENGRLNINSKVFGTYKRNNSVRECYTGDNFEDADNIIKLMIYVLTGITLISIIPPIFFILKAAVVFSREK